MLSKNGDWASEREKRRASGCLSNLVTRFRGYAESLESHAVGMIRWASDSHHGSVSTTLVEKARQFLPKSWHLATGHVAH